MKQPKFKFGDKVMRTAWKKDFFIVRKARWIPNCYLYTDDCGAEFEEFELELYQEPKKKKIFAYTYEYSTGGKNREIKFLAHDEPTWGSWERTPEFDLEYP